MSEANPDPDDGWHQHQAAGGQGSPHEQGPSGAYGHEPHAYQAPPPPQTAHPAQSAEGRTNVFAVISFIASILGLIAVLPFLGSIIGIVLAWFARKEITEDPTQGGKGLADWGLILGVVGLVLWLFLGLMAAMMAAMFGAWWMDEPWWW